MTVTLGINIILQVMLGSQIIIHHHVARLVLPPFDIITVVEGSIDSPKIVIADFGILILFDSGENIGIDAGHLKI